MLLDSHSLAPRAKSNLVILNYTDPLTKPYLQEYIAVKLHALDLQVAVKGKYGPVVGRYFIDFNEGALKEQKEQHWDGSEEEILDPLPHLDN